MALNRLDSISEIQTENFNQEIRLDNDSLEQLRKGIEEYESLTDIGIDRVVLEEMTNNGTYLGTKDGDPVLGTNEGMLRHKNSGEGFFLFMLFHELGHHARHQHLNEEDMPYMRELMDEDRILEDFSNDLIDTAFGELVAELTAYQVSSGAEIELDNEPGRNPFYNYEQWQFHKEIESLKAQQSYAESAVELRESLDNDWSSVAELEDDFSDLSDEDFYETVLDDDSEVYSFSSFDERDSCLEKSSYWADLYRNLETVALEDNLNESLFLAEYLRQNPVKNDSDPVHDVIRQKVEFSSGNEGANTLYDVIRSEESAFVDKAVEAAREKVLEEIDYVEEKFYHEEEIGKDNVIEAVKERSDHRSSHINYHHGIGCLTGEILYEKGVEPVDVLENEEDYQEMLLDIMEFTFEYGLESDFGIKPNDPEEYRERLENQIKEYL